MSNYAIDNGTGDQITCGIPAHTARATAQRIADERGESVWLYEERQDDEAADGPAVPTEEITPSEDLEDMIATVRAGGDRVTGGEYAGMVAQEWRDAGLTAAQASAYIEAGCWDADAVAELIAAGVTPEHLADDDVLARVVHAVGPVTDNLAYAHSNNDLATDAIVAAVWPRCECGQWCGTACTATLGEDAATVEFMPDHLRDSHVAAGGRGVYPHNGAVRIRVHPTCAVSMVDMDGEWCSVVAARPSKA